MGHSQIVCVTGAGGFIGAHLLSALSEKGVTIRILSRSEVEHSKAGVETYIGDLIDRNSLVPFLAGADLLINLAHPAALVSDVEFSSAISNLAISAREACLKRVLHTSTAMVVGKSLGNVVDELSELRPVSAYERRKCLAETIIQEELSGTVDVGVIRPTAVFGSGSQNLLKLAATIIDGPVWRREVLRFVHGTRRMHLVNVDDVVAAICFFAFSERSLCGNVFLVSADEEPENNYQAVDSILGKAMGKPGPKKSTALPHFILKALLAVAGRSQSNPQLFFDGSKLKSWGFNRSAAFEIKLSEFAQNYIAAKGSK